MPDSHTISGHLVVRADLEAWSSVRGTAVWVLDVVWLSTLVVWIERAAGSIAWHTGDEHIGSLHLCWVPADHLGNEREGRSLRSHKGNESRLAEHRGWRCGCRLVEVELLTTRRLAGGSTASYTRRLIGYLKPRHWRFVIDQEELAIDLSGCSVNHTGHEWYALASHGVMGSADLSSSHDWAGGLHHCYLASKGLERSRRKRLSRDLDAD